MKINFSLSKVAFCMAMENCWQAVRGCVVKNVPSHTMDPGVVPVRVGMYGLMVMSGHEQDHSR